jgi:hypothetical protein
LDSRGGKLFGFAPHAPFGPETLEAMEWAFKAAIAIIENGEPLLDAKGGN